MLSPRRDECGLILGAVSAECGSLGRESLVTMAEAEGEGG